MKKILLTGLIALAVAFFSGTGPASAVSVGDYSAGDAAGGLTMSRHNMGSLGRVITTSATSQICVFCHTPHHTNQSGGVAPLWNRSTTNASSYTAYGTTISGTTVANGDLGSSTLACLSCHDGVTTFDNLINRPGKDTITGDQNWVFRMPNIGFAIEGTGLDHLTSGAPCSICHQAGTGTDVQARLNIGTSLSNDHPVSVPYTEGTASLRASASIISQIDVSSDLSATNANVMQNLWAVKGFFNTDATIGDLLRNNPNVTGATVECGSCHDPHFRNLSWDEAEPTWLEGGFTTWCNNDPENCTDGMFLRRVGGNTASGVCRTCHNK